MSVTQARKQWFRLLGMVDGHQRLETTAIYTTPSHRDLEKVVEKLEQDSNHRCKPRQGVVDVFLLLRSKTSRPGQWRGRLPGKLPARGAARGPRSHSADS